MTDANLDNTGEVNEPIRLYLSGGGHRAVLGGVGAIAALVDLDEWQHVYEVVSVSGGSFPSAALVADGPTGATRDPLGALAPMTHRLLDDGLRMFATGRRTLTMVAMAGVVAVTVSAMLIAVGVGPWSPPRWVALVAGLLAVPTTMVAGRRLATIAFRDFVSTVLGQNAAADLASKPTERRHLFCAAGLSSGVPYTLWAGVTPPMITWGECLREGYTVHDAAMASSSLPGLGGVDAPASLGRETLVDGGVVGIFGQQAHDPVNRRVGGALRASRAGPVPSDDVRQFAIDAGRHAVADSALGRRLARLSTMYALSRWLKVSLEATYVNDLDDAQDYTLIRLCWDRSMAATPGPLGPVLDILAQRTTSLGLRRMQFDRAISALVGGYAHTMVAVGEATTASEIEDGLDRLGERLDLNLRQSWNDAVAAAATIDTDKPNAKPGH